jgi:replication factor C small subunit
MSYVEWTEKYRPTRLEGIVGNRPIIKALIGFRTNKNFPRLLLVGDSGTGKTTAAYCLVNGIFGDDAEIREFNASDERGIDIIRFDVVEFASTKSPFGVAFRVIIFDECEGLTDPAQHALRRNMEIYSENCRFILTCNEMFPLIEALTSRCKSLPFFPIPIHEEVMVLKRICKFERVRYKAPQLIRIAKDSEGDLREAVETLQISAEGRDKISQDVLEGVTSSRRFEAIENMVVFALEGKIEKSFVSFDKACKYLTASNFTDFLIEELTYVGEDQMFSKSEKSMIAEALGNVYVSGKYINKNQVLSFLSHLYQSAISTNPQWKRRHL